MPRDGALTLSDVREPTLRSHASGAVATGAISSRGSLLRMAPTPSCRPFWRRSPIARRRARPASMTDAQRSSRALASDLDSPSTVARSRTPPILLIDALVARFSNLHPARAAHSKLRRLRGIGPRLGVRRGVS
jgi:hypothetical protein